MPGVNNCFSRHSRLPLFLSILSSSRFVCGLFGGGIDLFVYFLSKSNRRSVTRVVLCCGWSVSAPLFGDRVFCPDISQSKENSPFRLDVLGLRGFLSLSVTINSRVFVSSLSQIGVKSSWSWRLGCQCCFPPFDGGFFLLVAFWTIRCWFLR